MVEEESTDSRDLSHSMVHYLLTIHKLKESKGRARVTDIAKELGLTKGSVSTAINRLKKKNFVTSEEDCKFLVLTPLGHGEVHRILSARTLLFYFWRDFVGVSEEVAKRDSCHMEHLMDRETALKFFEFMKKLVSVGGENSQLRFETALDIRSFKSAEDFITAQKGDSYLPEGLSQ